MHAALLQASEATAMCSNGEAEGRALGHSLGALVALRWQLVMRRGLLGLATIFFEYLGSIVPRARAARTAASSYGARTRRAAFRRFTPPA